MTTMSISIAVIKIPNPIKYNNIGVRCVCVCPDRYHKRLGRSLRLSAKFRSNTRLQFQIDYQNC